MKKYLVLLALLLLVPHWAVAQDDDEGGGDAAPTVYPLAIFPFQERGSEVKGEGAKVTDILFAELVVNPDLVLVDREDLKKITEEQELSASGLVNPADANKIGHLTGARILITGSILQTNKTTYVVAKVIGTETGRVLGASVKGASDDDVDVLVAQLAEQVTKTLTERSADLVPKHQEPQDRLAALKENFPDGKRPLLFLDIEERHVGQAVIDPAVETELTMWAQELGFEVLDPATAARSQADVVISGEAFSETAGRVGNLISVKARVELKAVDRATNRILAADRDVTIEVDLTEQIAGKSALQEAAVNLAERLLPKLAASEDETPKKKRNK